MTARIFKTRPFDRWMRKTELTDRALCDAVAEMRRGFVDADLGGGLIKQRVALPCRGKSGSTRTLVATNKRDRWIFIFGFEKNERVNVSTRELKALKAIATDLLQLSAKEIAMHLGSGALREICHEIENQTE